MWGISKPGYLGRAECSAECLLAVACVILSGEGSVCCLPRVEQVKPLSSQLHSVNSPTPWNLL